MGLLVVGNEPSPRQMCCGIVVFCFFLTNRKQNSGHDDAWTWTHASMHNGCCEIRFEDRRD